MKHSTKRDLAELLFADVIGVTWDEGFEEGRQRFRGQLRVRLDFSRTFFVNHSSDEAVRGYDAALRDVREILEELR